MKTLARLIGKNGKSQDSLNIIFFLAIVDYLLMPAHSWLAIFLSAQAASK